MPSGKAMARAIDLSKLPPAGTRFIEPMLAKLVAELPAGDQWEYEIFLLI